MRGTLLLLATITLPLYLLDQATKLLIYYKLEAPIAVIPGFFNLVYVENTGAAFGLGKNNNFFFILLSCAVVPVVITGLIRGWFEGTLMRIGAALMLAGVFGNVTDRIWNKAVIDFLDFHVGNHHWPAFNVADSCICIAAALFLWSGFRAPKTEPVNSA